MTTHETSEIPVYPAVGFAGLIVLVSVISIFTVLAFLGSEVTGEGSRAVRSMSVPEEIHDVELTLFDVSNSAAAEVTQKQKHLETYGWTDEPGGLVHIPISEAMTLYLQQQEQP